MEGELNTGTVLTACCLFDSAVNNWQVDAGVKLLVCALEMFTGEAGVSREHRGWRCDVLPLFHWVLMSHEYPAVFHCQLQ